MQHDSVRPGERKLVVREPVGLVELLGGREKGALHALVLQAQHHHDIDVLQALTHVVIDMHAHLLDVGGKQGLGRDDADFRATEGGQRVDLRARHPGMQDVAHDRHAKA